MKRSRVPRLRHAVATTALVTSALTALPGCDDLGTTRWVPATALEPATRSQLTTAARRGLAGVGITVDFTLADLPAHRREAAALARAGWVRPVGSGYVVTAAGRRAASRDCTTGRGPCESYPVGRIAFDRVEDAGLRKTGLGGPLVLDVASTIRVVPTTALGRELARGSDLVCADHGVRRTWQGAATTADLLTTSEVTGDESGATLASAAAQVDASTPARNGGSSTCPSFPGQFAPDLTNNAPLP